MPVSEFHRLAALDNAALCAAMWRAHSLEVESRAGCVACSGTPPRLYPNVVTVDRTTSPSDQTQYIADLAARSSEAFSVKDSFKALALDGCGFELLFEAHWLHRPAGLAAGEPLLRWRTVTNFAALLDWEAAWGVGVDEPPLFLPAFMEDPAVKIMAGWAGGTISAGCIVTATGGVAGLSNLFGNAGETINAAVAAFSDYDLVGYESGDALAASIDAGFRVVGDLVVWKRSVHQPASR